MIDLSILVQLKREGERYIAGMDGEAEVLLVHVMDCLLGAFSPSNTTTTASTKKQYHVQMQLLSSKGRVSEEFVTKPCVSLRLLHWDHIIEISLPRPNTSDTMDDYSLRFSLYCNDVLFASATSDDRLCSSFPRHTRNELILHLKSPDSTVFRLRIGVIVSDSKTLTQSTRTKLTSSLFPLNKCKQHAPKANKILNVEVEPSTIYDEITAVFGSNTQNTIPCRTFVEFVRVKMSEALAVELDEFITSNESLRLHELFQHLAVSKRDAKGLARSFHRESVYKFVEAYVSGAPSSNKNSSNMADSIANVQTCLENCDKLLLGLLSDFSPSNESDAAVDSGSASFDASMHFNVYVSDIKVLQSKFSRLLEIVRGSEARQLRLSANALELAADIESVITRLKSHGRTQLDLMAEEHLAIASHKLYAQILSSLKDIRKIERRLQTLLRMYQDSKPEPLEHEVKSAIADEPSQPLEDALCKAVCGVFPFLSEQLLRQKLSLLPSTELGRVMLTSVNTDAFHRFWTDYIESNRMYLHTIPHETSPLHREVFLLADICHALFSDTCDTSQEHFRLLLAENTTEFGPLVAVSFVWLCAPSLYPKYSPHDFFVWLESVCFRGLGNKISSKLDPGTLQICSFLIALIS